MEYILILLLLCFICVVLYIVCKYFVKTGYTLSTEKITDRNLIRDYIERYQNKVIFSKQKIPYYEREFLLVTFAYPYEKVNGKLQIKIEKRTVVEITHFIPKEKDE